MRRRTFLKNLGALGGGGLATCNLPRLVASTGSLPDRFRLGVISDELSQDFEEALRIMKGYGLNWVEVRTVWKTYNTEASPEQVQRIRTLLEQHDFKVSVIDTALYKCDLPGAGNVMGDWCGSSRSSSSAASLAQSPSASVPKAPGCWPH